MYSALDSSVSDPSWLIVIAIIVYKITASIQTNKVLCKVDDNKEMSFKEQLHRFGYIQYKEGVPLKLLLLSRCTIQTLVVLLFVDMYQGRSLTLVANYFILIGIA